MSPGLQWISELHAVFNQAVDRGSTGYEVKDDVNPLKKNVIFHLRERLGKGQYMPFQSLAHGFAKANKCVLERIYHQDRKLILVILLRRRLGPVQAKNPLS